MGGGGEGGGGECVQVRECAVRTDGEGFAMTPAGEAIKATLQCVPFHIDMQVSGLHQFRSHDA